MNVTFRKAAVFFVVILFSLSGAAYAQIAVKLNKREVRVFVVDDGISYLVDRLAGLCFLQRTQKTGTPVMVEVSCEKLKKHSEIKAFFDQGKTPAEPVATEEESD